MKALIILIGMIVTGVIAIATADKNISGTWLMQQGDSPAYPPVLRINMNEGIWEGKMDIPQQELYNKKVHSIRVKGDSVFITVYKNGSTIFARVINDTAITGVMQTEGRQDAVKFKKI